MNKLILFKLKPLKEKESMRSLEIEYFNRKNPLKKEEIEELLKTKNIVHTNETISIDNTHYEIFLNGDTERIEENINYGFWWSYGNEKDKHKYYGDVLCIKEISYEIN